MKKVFAVFCYGVLMFHTDDELTAHAYKSSNPNKNYRDNSEVRELKMSSKLYKRAYKFLKLRSQGKDMFEALNSLEGLNLAGKQLVKNFLSYNHQVKFI